MKLFKYLLAIPVVGFIIAIIGLTLAAPLFLTLFTVKVYEEYVPTAWKAITYPISIIAEVALVVAMIMDREPVIFVVLTVVILFHLAISSMRFRAKQKRDSK